MRNVGILLLFLFGFSYGIFHTNSRGTQNHTPFRWVFADSAARVAESVTTSDTDKVAYQKSDSSIWVLRDNDPKTWIQLNYQYAYTESGVCSVYVNCFSGKDSMYVLWERAGNIVNILFPAVDTATADSTTFNITIPAQMPQIQYFPSQVLDNYTFFSSGSTKLPYSVTVSAVSNGGQSFKFVLDGLATAWNNAGGRGLNGPLSVMYLTTGY